MSSGSEKPGLEKKVVSRNVALALGVICILVLAALVGVYASYTSTINSKNTKITGLNSQITTLNTELSGNISAISSLNTQTSTLNSELSSDSSSISSLNTQITSLNTQITSLKSEVGANATTIATLESEVTSLQSNVTNLQNILTLATKLATAYPTINITLVGATGTKVVLNAYGIAKLYATAVSGYGGLRNNSGKLQNYGNYTGLSVLTLLNQVGGVTSSQSVISVDDNYNVTMSYSTVTCALGSSVVAYFSNGTQDTGPTHYTLNSLNMIIAYECNGTALPSSEGPLRVVVVGSQGLYTTGSIWNYDVWELVV